MTRDLQMRMQELRYTTTVRERLEGELAGARSIQMSLLPKVFPAFPSGTNSISTRWCVRRVKLVVISTIFTSSTISTCACCSAMCRERHSGCSLHGRHENVTKATSCSTLTAGEIVAKVNNELCDESVTGMFVTLLYAILHTGTGEVQFSNAGHHLPLSAPERRRRWPAGMERAVWRWGFCRVLNTR
jgi:sigma-B regulation protein RsbU (phosphoserine phosphatase)